MYEIIRTVYTSPTADSTDSTDASRVAVLQQTLSQLRLTNIATLDACMNHFTRLIDLTSADDEYVTALATTLAPCILRPRTETSLTLEEKHSLRLVRDLFAHKGPIFSELKRMSTLNHSSSVGERSRPRAVSTDESNRKALMEERNRALLEKANASRGRATSPAPSPRGHRRDRSSGGPDTRFPIQTSPTSSAAERQRTSLGGIEGRIKRSSLDVPDPESSASAAAAADGVNGLSQTTKSSGSDTASEKRDSGGRVGTKFVAGKRVPASPPQEVEVEPTPRGVTLEDKPMDD